MHTTPRLLAAALSALGILAWALPAWAAEPLRTSPGRPAQWRVQPDADGQPIKPPLGRAVTEEEDSETIDQLRERLARKLGAQASSQRAAEKPEPGVLRVIARPATPPPAAAATAEPRRAAARPAPKKKPEHWSYEGEGGPEHWAHLKPEYAQCGNGKRQSPIDIRDGISVQMDPVQFDYRPSAFRVIDNGHTVQVNVAPGNTIEVMGRRYELQQFHFHRPSEERINGRQYDMVAHLVHKDVEGKFAVVAVLLDRGSPQPVVQQVWNNLPLEKHEELAARHPIDLNGLLPAERGYYTYMGSLTTPPCSEGVLWMVMKSPVSIASEQIGIFSRLYPMNARPVQAAAGRMIKGSD